MDLTQLADLGEFIGGVAVLATLGYLAAQVRQTNRWNRQQGFREIQGRSIDWMEQVTSTKEIAHLYNTGCAHYEDLDDDDRFRFNWIQGRRWASFELTLDYHKGGSMKNEILDIVEDYLRKDLSQRGIQRWWAAFGRDTFARDFRDHVDRIYDQSVPGRDA